MMQPMQGVLKHPSLARGQVWCRTCGYTEKVDPVACLAHGWPKCCGYTMTIDEPKEGRDGQEGD